MSTRDENGAGGAECRFVIDPPPRSCHCECRRGPVGFGIHPIQLAPLRLHVWGPGSTMHKTDGRAALLWRLQGRQSMATCVLEPLAVGALLTVRQDDEVAFQETFPDAHLAEDRAEALRRRLEAKGWRLVPDVAERRRHA